MPMEKENTQKTVWFMLGFISEYSILATFTLDD